MSPRLVSMTILSHKQHQESVQWINTPSQGVFGNGLRGIAGGFGSKGLNGAIAGLIGKENTVQTSYESTMSNLKILKKKCIPRDHVVIPPVGPVDVKHRIATSLQIPPSSVDFTLNHAIFSLCDGQSFWLGEMIIHMLEHGLVDFTAQLHAEGWMAVRRGSQPVNRFNAAVDQFKRG